ncbi:MAG: GNAT family N-acetyltransferase [Cytophagaceae bacterium]|nr:GNAT family N-acetyltransferase [Cytophagaceae bacterium]
MEEFKVQVANEGHKHLAEVICKEMEESAKARGTGIAKRNPDYIRQKMEEGKAIIATTKSGEFAGFCYLETWGHGKYVSNSGLIVSPNFRKSGLATKIKIKAFNYTRKKYPDAKLFGLTTSAAVMKINSELGYRPVHFTELTDDEQFWKGCSSCINYEILQSKERKLCLCTGMLYDPVEIKEKKWDFIKKSKIWERLQRIKDVVLLKPLKKIEGLLRF